MESKEGSARCAVELEQEPADDDDDAEEEEQEQVAYEDYTLLTNASLFQAQQETNGVIDPEGAFRVAWDIGMLLLLLARRGPP